MKKLLILFCILLSMVSCICDQKEELCSVTTEYNKSEMTVTPSETTVFKGQTVELSYMPIEGRKVTKITVNGVDAQILDDNKVRFVAEGDSHVYFATEKTTFYSTVNVSASYGGTVSPSGLNTVEVGKDLYLHILASNNYWVDSVYVNGVGRKVEEFTEEYYYHYTGVDTLHYEFLVTFVQKKTYTLIVQIDSLTICNYSGSYKVTEGKNVVINLSAKQFCSIISQTIDGVAFTGSSLTLSKVNADHVVVITSKKEPEWFLVNIKWKLAYLNIGGTEYVPYNEVFDFLSDGTYKRYFNDKPDGYIMNWYKNNGVLTFQYQGIYQIATVDKIDDTVLIFHYSKTIKAFENIGYK